MFKVGDWVETIKGVGVIKDIRRQYGSDRLAYLICTGKDGFGGDHDVYSEDDFVALDKPDNGV